MAARSSAAGGAPTYARSSVLGGSPALRRYTPSVVAAEPTTPPSPIIDIVTSVNLIGHLSPGYASSGTHFAWEDTSNYANHFTSSGVQRPTLVADWLDGNPGVRFDGVTQRLHRAVLRGMPVGSKACMIIVGTADSDVPEVSGTLLLVHGDTLTFAAGTSDRLCNVGWRIAGIMETNARLGSAPAYARAHGVAAVDDDPHWLMFVTSNASNRAESYFDGELVATSAAGAAGGLYETATHAYIGGTAGDAESDPANRWFKGTLGEIVIFDGVPTSGEIEDLFADIMEPHWPSLTWSFS